MHLYFSILNQFVNSVYMCTFINLFANDIEAIIKGLVRMYAHCILKNEYITDCF